ncbi:hypothetical protein [Klebsiella quasipneumoniae]|uniref:hypothetical protein n=1 Tax=Klebsiella quasipneumoniae TaxID=1463165 RepID=UPI003F1C74C7
MFTINNQFVFWLVLAVHSSSTVLTPITDAPSSLHGLPMRRCQPFGIYLKLALNCSDSQNCGFLSLYVIGVSCTYRCFIQHC